MPELFEPILKRPAHDRTGLDPSVPRATIRAVIEGSPADDAGFYPGCALLTAQGQPLRDCIDWHWLASDDELLLTYVDGEGDVGEVELVRDPGEEWGFEFEGAIWDKIKLCRNACTFCFMRQLPEDVRDTLVLRDDDFRLSFLQGTFVTLTNLSEADEARIVEQAISPLRLSIHCITPELRRKVIGKHAQHGIDAAERLMEAGIRFHGQIVLMPDVNDGDELQRTLEWAWEQPGMETVGIVPLGFSKHQDRFHKSFDAVEDARAVIDCIRPFQARALAERGTPWAFAADEFYRNAFPDTLLDELPPSSWYGDFDMFEDGIGIVRSFVDDWEASSQLMDEVAAEMRAKGMRFTFVTGMAMREFFEPLIASSPLQGLIEPLAVRNDHFGGNINVTGLLAGCDVSRALRASAGLPPLDPDADTDADAATTESDPGTAAADAVAPATSTDAGDPGDPAEPATAFALLPKIMFNADGLTLDDMDVAAIERAAGVPVRVVSCNASEFLKEIRSFC